MGLLEGKVAIITGSTSGMGRETAYRFAKEGAKVLVTGRDEERAKAVVEKIRAEGGEAAWVIADITESSAAQKIFDACMEAFGTVDVLMNNAGMINRTPFMQLEREEFLETFNTNVSNAMFLTQLCAEVMIKKGKGSVINVGSIAGCHGHYSNIAYVTSKHAMAGMTKRMAWDLGPYGVRVNGLFPGTIQTEMLDRTGGPEAYKSFVEKTPLRRLGAAEEIASVAVFFASDESSFVTGQILRVDGGIDI